MLKQIGSNFCRYSPYLNNRSTHYLETLRPHLFCPSHTRALPTSSSPKEEDAKPRKRKKRTRAPSKPSVPASSDPVTYVSGYFQLNEGEVEKYLDRHAFIHRCTREHAIVEECPFCPPTKSNPDNLNKLYILRESGAFLCHRCKSKGSWFDFRKQLSFGDETISSLKRSTTSKKRPSIPANSDSADKQMPRAGTQETFVGNLWGKNTSGEELVAKRYLNEERGLTDKVLKKYGVGLQRFPVMVGRQWKDHLCVTFPMYDGNGSLVRHKIRSILQKSGMRLEPKGGNWGLFGLDTVPKDAEEVILTEGEFDAMSVFQATGRPAISLPNGASSLPLSLLVPLERFKRIYVWMDEDDPGQAGAQQFCKKLGLKRCLSVRGLGGSGRRYKDANDALLEKADFEKLLNQADVIQHGGLLMFEDLRDQILAELMNDGNGNSVKSQSLPRLNELLKGHRPGELTIFSGHTGVGKTTLLSQLALDYCMQDVATLWGSFEVSNVRLGMKLLTQFHAVKGDGGRLVDAYEYWADRFSELPMYFMKYHGSNPVERVLDAMEYANYVYDCRHVILDNLQFMTNGQSNRSRERFEIMDNAVGEIRTFCTSKNVHVSLVVHPRKEDDEVKIQTASVFGSAKATQEADNVIIMQRTVEGKTLEVKKNRYDGALGGFGLRFDSKGLLYSQTDNGKGWALREEGGEKRKKVGKKSSMKDRRIWKGGLEEGVVNGEGCISVGSGVVDGDMEANGRSNGRVNTRGVGCVLNRKRNKSVTRDVGKGWSGLERYS